MKHMNNNPNVDLRKLFKDNYTRFKSLNDNNHDSITKFEALYNCFENVGQLTTGQSNGKMIESLKENKETNILRKNFLSLQKISFYMKNHIKSQYNKSLLFYLIELRQLSPIYNNTREQKVFITKEQPFETFLDVLYVVRNNARHGVKEFSDRSDEILSHTIGILEVLISETYNTIFEKELLEIKKNKRKNENNLNTIKTILSFIAFLLFIPFISFILSLFGSKDKNVLTVDCSGLDAKYSSVCNPAVQNEGGDPSLLYRGR